jgi:cyclic pyranopterin phosphate synthase
MRQDFTVVSLNISSLKGTKKHPIEEFLLIPDLGIEGDAHAGPGKRQVSLLAIEDIDAAKAKGTDVYPGAFAENITTLGVELPSLPIGTILTIGQVELEISQIGKECHAGCEIMKVSGDCIMPRRGIFAYVRRGGRIKREDTGHYDI